MIYFCLCSLLLGGFSCCFLIFVGCLCLWFTIWYFGCFCVCVPCEYVVCVLSECGFDYAVRLRFDFMGC